MYDSVYMTKYKNLPFGCISFGCLTLCLAIRDERCGCVYVDEFMWT